MPQFDPRFQKSVFIQTVETSKSRM